MSTTDGKYLNKQGQLFEESVENWLIKEGIPYWRRVKIFDSYKRDVLTEFDFIIPGGIIEVKDMILTLDKKSHMRDVIKQIKTQQELLPSGIRYWLYLNDKNKIDKSFISDSIENMDVSVIYNIGIPCMHMLASSFNESSYSENISRYKSRLYTTRYVFNKAIALLKDNELDRLISYNIQIVDEIPINNLVCHLVHKNGYHYGRHQTMNEVIKLFGYFKIKLNKNYLDKKRRYYQRHIEGITKYCEKCGIIVPITFNHCGQPALKKRVIRKYILD